VTGVNERNPSEVTGGLINIFKNKRRTPEILFIFRKLGQCQVPAKISAFSST